MPEWIDITTTQDVAEMKRRFLNVQSAKQEELVIKRCPYPYVFQLKGRIYDSAGPLCYESGCPYNHTGYCIQ